jgi:F-type H+-transporting ATPase subunit epsilon
MASTLHVDIVSAEAEIFSGNAEFLIAPAEMGEVGIAPRHAPLLTRLVPGEIRVKLEGGEEASFFVSGGILEVQPKITTILADTVVRAHDLDEAAALAAKQSAEEALANRKSDLDYASVRTELAEAMAQLQAISRLRKKAGR